MLLHAPGALADIVLRPGAQISGTVWDGHGNVMTEARMSFVVLSRTPEARDLISKVRSLWPRAKVDQLGYYKLTDLPLASMNVCVLTQGNSIEYPFQTVTPKSGDSLVVNFGDKGEFAGL